MKQKMHTELSSLLSVEGTNKYATVRCIIGHKYLGYFEYRTPYCTNDCAFCFHNFATRRLYWTSKNVYDLGVQVAKLANLKLSLVVSSLLTTLVTEGRIRTRKRYEQIVNSRQLKNLVLCVNTQNLI